MRMRHAGDTRMRSIEWSMRADVYLVVLSGARKSDRLGLDGCRESVPCAAERLRGALWDAGAFGRAAHPEH